MYQCQLYGYICADLEKHENFLVYREYNAAREHQSAQTHRASSPEGLQTSILPCAPDSVQECLALTTLRAGLDGVKGLGRVYGDATCDSAHGKSLQCALGCVAHAGCVLCPERVV